MSSEPECVEGQPSLLHSCCRTTCLSFDGSESSLPVKSSFATPSIELVTWYPTRVNTHVCHWLRSRKYFILSRPISSPQCRNVEQYVVGVDSQKSCSPIPVPSLGDSIGMIRCA